MSTTLPSPQVQPPRRSRAWIHVPILALALGTALAQKPFLAPLRDAATGELRRTPLRWVATNRAFQDINHNDVRAALKVLYDLLAAKRGFILDSSVDIVDSLAEVRARLDSHSVDVLMLGAGDYLELETALPGPILTDARTSQGAAFYSYVLLVKASSGAASAASLRKKNIMVSSRSGGSTGSAWLEVLLAREKLGPAASFFHSLATSPTARTCILPLFFGTVDACVVDEVSLNLAKELNPQLAQLKVLARSRPLVESVITAPRTTAPFHKDLVDAMLSLHDDPRGRQLLMVFKTGRVVRIQPGDLEGTRELWKEYDRLPGSRSSKERP